MYLVLYVYVISLSLLGKMYTKDNLSCFKFQTYKNNMYLSNSIPKIIIDLSLFSISNRLMLSEYFIILFIIGVSIFYLFCLQIEDPIVYVVSISSIFAYSMKWPKLKFTEDRKHHTFKLLLI